MHIFPLSPGPTKHTVFEKERKFSELESYAVFLKICVENVCDVSES